MSETTGTPEPLLDPTPASAPAPTPAPEPVPAAEPVPEAAPEPAPESTPEPAVPGTPAEPESPKVEPPAADAPPDFADLDKKPDAAAPVEVVTYDFKVPEGVTVEPAKMEAYTGLLKEVGVSPEVGQKLLDLYTAERVEDTQRTLTRQYEVFNTTLREWDEQRKGDPEIGGAGIETATKMAAKARDLVVDDTNRQEFNDFLAATGAGRHPAFWRIMYRFGKALREPVPPPENRTPPPQPSGRPNGIRSFFDHETSNRQN